MKGLPTTGTTKGPIFDTTGFRVFSSELRALNTDSDTMGTYVLLKKGVPMYIGVAILQPIYKTITRHFQRHRDSQQGRWIARPPKNEESLWTFVIVWADEPREALELEAKLVLTNRPEGNIVFNEGLMTSKQQGKFFKFAKPYDKLVRYETDGAEGLDTSKPLSLGTFEDLRGRIRDLDSYKEYLDSLGADYRDQEKEEKRALKALNKELQEIEERDKNI